MMKKMNRRETREAAFILIFESLFRDDSPEALLELAGESEEIGCSSDTEVMFRGVLERAAELDAIIARYSEKRQFDRIAKVNIAVLRLALYEILHEDRVPMGVAIHEAVQISQKYSLEADTAFVNGVLGAFSRSPEAPKEKPGVQDAPGKETEKQDRILEAE